MFYYWICWQALACAETGYGGDIDMASFYLRLKLYSMKKKKSIFFFDEAYLQLKKMRPIKIDITEIILLAFVLGLGMVVYLIR